MENVVPDRPEVCRRLRRRAGGPAVDRKARSAYLANAGAVVQFESDRGGRPGAAALVRELGQDFPPGTQQVTRALEEHGYIAADPQVPVQQ